MLVKSLVFCNYSARFVFIDTLQGWCSINTASIASDGLQSHIHTVSGTQDMVIVGQKVSKYEPLHKNTIKLVVENIVTDQLCSNCTADQLLCFRYTDSIIPIVLKFKVSSL